MEPEVLGWEPLSNTWLATRTPQDAHVRVMVVLQFRDKLVNN